LLPTSGIEVLSTEDFQTRVHENLLAY